MEEGVHMLVLSRKVGQELVIGDNIRITVNRVGGSRVTLGITAPGDVRVVRGELERIVKSFEAEADVPGEPVAESESSDEAESVPCPATWHTQDGTRLIDVKCTR
jgi:carbon storage regulator CsrA